MAIWPLPRLCVSAKNGKSAMDRPKMLQTNYGVIERALLRSYRLPKSAVGAFRGRLGSLQKQGLFGEKNMPGKGVALTYGLDQAHRLVFACELFEFGVAPATVLNLVKTAWDRRLRKIFEDAEKVVTRNPGPEDVILHMGGVHMMTDTFADAVPNVNQCQLRKLPTFMLEWMKMTPDDP